MFCAVIVAAGQSRRAGFDKLAAPLAGLPVLCHSVRAFAQAGAERIVIVCQQARWDELRPWESAGSVPVQRADGGGGGRIRCCPVCARSAEMKFGWRCTMALVRS